jgi:hypothetical protein
MINPLKKSGAKEARKAQEDVNQLSLASGFGQILAHFLHGFDILSGADYLTLENGESGAGVVAHSPIEVVTQFDLPIKISLHIGNIKIAHHLSGDF